MEVLLPDTAPPPVVTVGRPLHPSFLGAPLLCFVAALIADIAYVQTYDILWKNFADWLLAGGMVVGALAAIIGIVDLVRRRVRANRLIWPYAVAYAVAMILGLFDNFIHSRDAYGAMPAGLTLSALTVLVLVVTAVIGVLLIRDSRTGSVR
jgi:uncharacterized membrane protein